MALIQGLMKAHDGHQRCLVLPRIQETLPNLQMAAALRVPGTGHIRSRACRGRTYMGLRAELRCRWEMTFTLELSQYAFPGPRLRPAGNMEGELASLELQTPA